MLIWKTFRVTLQTVPKPVAPISRLLLPLAWLDPSSRVFPYALAASIVLHAMVLSIQFHFPDGKRHGALQPLDVVIVNSRTRSKPSRPEVLAQANLDGGGNTDLSRRAKSPLPVMERNKRGEDVVESTRRVKELEAQQRQLLTQLESKVPAASQAAVAQPAPEAKPQISGAELANKSLAMIRHLEAQVSSQIDEYNKRPRKQFVGARASEYRFAQYVDDWRLKIERIGNLNYPESARGRLYGTLRVSVSINADGSLNAVELERSSGHQVLDRAAERIVKMGAPYAKFPTDISRDTDILVITRTWHFEPGDKLLTD